MKLKELKQKTNKELNEILVEDRYKLGELKYELSSKKLKNVMEIRQLRRKIARIITLLKQKHE